MTETFAFYLGSIFVVYGYVAIAFGSRFKRLAHAALYLNSLALALGAEALLYTTFDRVWLGKLLIQLTLQIAFLEALRARTVSH